MKGIGRNRAAATTRRSVIVLAGLLPVLLVALLKLAVPGAFAQTSGLVFDSYQRLSPRPYRDAGMRVVDIDDESIRRLGQWPWPRTDLAALAERIAGAGAAVVGFDIVFSEADRSAGGVLSDLLARHGASPE
jgi:adenylate cyclase